MIYAFTGVVDPPPDAYWKIRRAIRRLQPNLGAEFRSGGAVGIDTLVVKAVLAEYPWAHQRIVVPGAPRPTIAWNPWLEKQLAPAVDSIEVEFVEGGRTPADSCMKRNDALVAGADRLLAFPHTCEEEFRGSGTWATIRRAQKAGVPVTIVPLSGK